MFFARALTLLLLLCAAASSQAQERPIRPSRFAVDVSYKLGAPVTFDRASGRLVHFGSTKTGTSKDESFGLGASIGYNISDAFELGFGIGYRRGSGQFKSDIFSLADTQRMEFTIDTKYDALDFDLLAGYELASWLTLSGGLTMTVYPSNEATQTRRLIEVVGASKDEIAVFASGEDILGKRVHVSVPLGMRMPLWYLSPSSVVGLDVLGGLNITEGLRGYWGQSAKLEVGLWWAPHWEDEIVEPPQPLAIVAPKIEDRSSFNRDGKSDTLYVQVVDSIRTHYESLPQIIYFDRESTILESLPLLSSIDHHLSQVAQRLSDDPLARLTIELQRGEGEAASLDQQRVTLFERVLQHVKGRYEIKIGKQLSGLGQASISSNNPATLLPIRTSETWREQWVEGLSIRQSTIAEAGVKQWSLIVRTHSDTLFAFGSGLREISAFDEFTFAIPENTDRLYLHSYAIDNQGQRSDSYDTLHVAIAMHNKRDITIDEYVMLNQPSSKARAFSYDASLLDAIVSSITPGSHVEVSNVLEDGFDDMTQTISKILEGCRARGALPQKIEAKPAQQMAALTPALIATYGNAVRVRVVTAPRQ